VDAALAELGLRRRAVGSVGTFSASLFVFRDTDLVGMISSWSRSLEPVADGDARPGHRRPAAPAAATAAALAWHPRHDADPAHAWLRTHDSTCDTSLPH
jgi:hypothetical protein